MAFRFMAQRVVPTTLPLLVYTTTGLLTLTLLAASPVRGDLPDPHPAIPAELTLSWCLERARAANPALESAHASAAAASSRVGFAGALDDPRIVYEASNIPTGDLDFRSTPLSGHQLGLKQKLPFPGLLSSREIAAERSAEASALSVDDQALITDGNVEAAWAELRFAQRALGITDRNVALLRQLAATAETRYRVGNGLQQDVLRAQVELTALLQERLRREEAALRAESHLVELLDLPATTKLPRTGDAPSVHEEPVLEPILASLDQRNAGLNAARKSVEAAEARLRSVELEGLPDVDLAIGYRVRRDVSGDPVNGDDFLSAGITVRLPVNRSKWRARSSLVSRTRRAHAALMRASAEAELLESGLIPQARQSLESSRSAYEVGRIEFLSLLDSQVRLLTAELRLARARADRRQAFASLEVAAGEKLR
jgi:outer membrane protein TolC